MTCSRSDSFSDYGPNGLEHRFVDLPGPIWPKVLRKDKKELALSTPADTLHIESWLSHEEDNPHMAIHLTPTELGREAGMHRREVIAKCMELGVPIFQGRIDKTLFTTTLKQAGQKKQLASA